MIPRPAVTLVLCVFLFGMLYLTGAEQQASAEVEGVREKRSMPNWALTSDDFFGWVDELRRHAGYEKMEELARTFWAHFPSASRLGYETDTEE